MLQSRNISKEDKVSRNKHFTLIPEVLKHTIIERQTPFQEIQPSRGGMDFLTDLAQITHCIAFNLLTGHFTLAQATELIQLVNCFYFDCEDELLQQEAAEQVKQFYAFAQLFPQHNAALLLNIRYNTSDAWELTIPAHKDGLNGWGIRAKVNRNFVSGQN